MRLLLLTPLGILFCLLVFWLMQWMITPTAETAKRDDNIAMVDFIRSLKDSSSEAKQRNLKEPPKPKTPPMPKTAKIQQAAVQSMKLEMPDISPDFSAFKATGPGNILSGYGFGDSDVIALVQPRPRYPAQALSRKIEGWVMVKFNITKDGTVDAVEVVDSKPKGVFEREAVRAAWRYKFKPKLVDGSPVVQVATLPFEFTLEK
jgi:protein TonB